MNKLIAIAAFIAALAAAPVLAQEAETYTAEQVAEAAAAIEAAELTDTAHRDFWCGSAFLILTQMLEAQGNAEASAQTLALSDVVYARVATEMVEAGVSEADFNALAQNFRIVAIAQTGEGGEADYTQEECMAAAQ